MSKLNMILLIVFLTVSLQANDFRDNYTPPTDNQLLEWWNSLDQEARILELRKLDEIENSIPKIDMPKLIAILTKRGDLIIKQSQPITVRVSYLEYEVNLKAQKINEFYSPRKGFKDFFLPISLGMASALMGSFVTGNAKPEHLLFSGLQGASLGFIVSIGL